MCNPCLPTSVTYVSLLNSSKCQSPPFHKFIGGYMPGTGAAGACPGVGPRRMQRSLAQLKPRSNDGDRPAGQSLHFRSRRQMHTGTGTCCCLSRCGTAADTKIVGATEAAVQRRGQARRASPPCPKPQADAYGTGTCCLSRCGTAADAKIVV